VLCGKKSGGGYGYGYTVNWDDRLFSSVDDSGTETGDEVAFCFHGGVGAAGKPVQIDWVFLSKFWIDPVQGSWGIEEGIGPAAQSPVAALIWGTRCYADVMGGTNELSLSVGVCDYIQELFEVTGRYGYCTDYCGLDTQPSVLYNAINYTDSNFSNTVIFYKGHSYPGRCNVQGCTFYHFSIYDNEGPQDPNQPNNLLNYKDVIQDYIVHDHLSSFSNGLVVLWTCGSAWENATGGFNGTHSYGWEASWMNTTNLSTDAYHVGTSDSSGRCFIGFANFSICFTNTTGRDGFNYGHFAYYFFYYALQGWSIRNALDKAVQATHQNKQYFDQCQLYSGYSMWDPRQTPWTDVNCTMRIWGDGGSTIPH
jgi:hypothetical protein